MADDKHCLINRKPYRTAHLKRQAKRKARKCKDGAFRAERIPTERHISCPCGDKYSPGNKCYARKTRKAQADYKRCKGV